jgi:hypothetical protein
MRKIIPLFVVLLPVFTSAQKITIDKTDPFTGIRMIMTNYSNLTSVLQVVSQLEVKNDSIISYKIAFIMPQIGAVVQTQDTASNFECFIKTISGEIVTGKYLGMATAPIGTRTYTVFTYILTAEDLKYLSINECTDVKFTAPNGQGALLEIDPRSKDKISKQCLILLQKMG